MVDKDYISFIDIFKIIKKNLFTILICIIITGVSTCGYLYYKTQKIKPQKIKPDYKISIEYLLVPKTKHTNTIFPNNIIIVEPFFTSPISNSNKKNNIYTINFNETNNYTPLSTLIFFLKNNNSFINNLMGKINFLKTNIRLEDLKLEPISRDILSISYQSKNKELSTDIIKSYSKTFEEFISSKSNPFNRKIISKTELKIDKIDKKVNPLFFIIVSIILGIGIGFTIGIIKEQKAK